MKSSQDIQKEIDYVMNFAEQMGVPDEVYFQFIAVADSYLRDGDYERAEQQVGQALLAAQSYGLKPEGTMRITESKLRRIIRNKILETRSTYIGQPGDRIPKTADELPELELTKRLLKKANKMYGLSDGSFSASEWVDYIHDAALELRVEREVEQIFGEFVPHFGWDVLELAADYGIVQDFDSDGQVYFADHVPSVKRKNYRHLREFGEKDADLIKKLQNRERMIGRGMDGGTIGFNPNWDYDKKPASKRAPRGYMGDIIKQVPYVIEQNDMHEWLEAVPTRNPEIIHLVSGDLVVKVENDYGTLTFDIIKPRNYNWSMECETIDNEIDNVLYELGEYVSEIENS